MRRVLIISPHSPPINAADMHRIRHSLPYYEEYGWRSTVLAVDPDAVEGSRDPLLLETVPDDADVRHVDAFSKRWTRRLGIGNPALRSFLQYARTGSSLLASGEYDLVYFSTTQFPIAVLGRYWKARFGVPYVIDVQDPWLSDHLVEGPEEEQLPKAQWAYRMHRVLEPMAMGNVDGIIAVSQGYCDTLVRRYDNVTHEMCSVIPFGAAQGDFKVLDRVDIENPFFDSDDDAINIVCVGRAGHDMATAARGIFTALAKGREERPNLFGRVRMHFVGTSYAPAGEGEKTIEPIARQSGVGDVVTEHTDRIPYFQALRLLRDADHLVIPGSDDPDYTASKLYPYILSRRPVLAVFNENSSVVDILEHTGAGTAVTFNEQTGTEALGQQVYASWASMLERLPYTPETNWDTFRPYTAEAMTKKQVDLFNQVVEP